MGHLGLRPQSVHQLGGYARRGTETREAEAIVEESEVLQAAGAFAVVLESIPAALAGTITARLRIPTIGIGAGPDCDGQVLVSTDMLGSGGRGAAVRAALRRPARRHHGRGQRLRGRRARGAFPRQPSADRRPSCRRPGAMPPEAVDVAETGGRAAGPPRRAAQRRRFDRSRAHDGRAAPPAHRALIERAQRECGLVVVTIFVKPATVRPRGRPAPLPAHAGGGISTPAADWASTWSLRRAARRCTRPRPPARFRSRAWPSTCAAGTGRGISRGAWRRLSSSCCRLRSRRARTSARRTRSRRPSSGASCATSTCRSTSWRRPSCASRMGWPSAPATCT